MKRRAFTLLEAVVCIVIVGAMLTASLGVVGSSALARRKSRELRMAQDLCRQFMGEVLAQPLTEPFSTGTLFGPDAGESSSPRTYDDVDDYNGLVLSPPTRQDGTVMPGYEGWQIEVLIERVIVRPTSISVVTAATGADQVTVIVTSPTGVSSRQQAVRSRFGPADVQVVPGLLDTAYARLILRSADQNMDVERSVELLNVPEVP